jgi:quercetin dioxygenase-like cupin family protein
MTRRQRIRWSCVSLATILLTAPVRSHQNPPLDASGFVALQPEDITWREGGGNQVVIAGDPNKAGLYAVRVRFAPGQGSRPHFHNQDRYVTVIKGTWWVALGPKSDVYDPSNAVPMKPGSFVKHPAGGHHYDGARDEEVIVQIIGIGPVTTTPVNSR